MNEEAETEFPIEFTKTQRGRDMLIYRGYRYVENRQSTKNKFWRCSRYVKFGCRATIVTSKNPTLQSVRLAGLSHSHGPERMSIRPESEKEDKDDVDEFNDHRSTAIECDSDGGNAFDLIQKSLFSHPDSSDIFVVDLVE